MADNGSIPTRCGIAELGRVDIVAGHREEPGVDLSFLVPANAIDRRLHIIIDPAPGNAAKDAESMPMGI